MSILTNPVSSKISILAEAGNMFPWGQRASGARNRAGSILRGALISAGLLLASAPASANTVYLALGDSITFGETNLLYAPSAGDRGYVADYADILGANTGIKPQVVNLAIDGETAASFMSGSGRTPPVVNRGDVPLQTENTNYDPAALVPQGTRLQQVVAAELTTGNTIGTVSITLGFNELAALSSLPTATALASLPATLAAYQTSYGAVLTQVRALAPSANLILLGYYNPFPADPTSPAAPIFNVGGVQLNGIIQNLAAQFDATYVDTAASFLGHESSYTYLAAQPHGSSVPDPFGGVLPIGNVHPNAVGYAVIAQDIAHAAGSMPGSVPEPATWAMMILGFGLVGAVTRRRQTSPAKCHDGS